MNAKKNVSQTVIDEALMRQVLAPYRKHATYLQKATFVTTAEEGKKTLFGAIGEFSIPISCYIDDTGHFNAVEYNICFNQIGFIFLAHCVKEGLLPEISDYDLDTFIEKQLSNVLIYRISSKFPKIMNAKKFYGELKVNSLKKVGGYTMFNSECRFWDDGEGRADGSVIAIMPSVDVAPTRDPDIVHEEEFISPIIEDYLSTISEDAIQKHPPRPPT